MPNPPDQSSSEPLSYEATPRKSYAISRRSKKAMTESAREARKAFYCDLCQKGYSRINELEAHQGSYDHTHRKRLKDLKTLTRASDPTATARARRAEEKATAEAIGGGGLSIKPISFGSSGGGGGGGAGGEKKTGFKKGGFKNAFAAVGGGEEAGGDAEGKGKGEEGARRKGEGEMGGEEGVKLRGNVDEVGGKEEDDDDDEDGKWGNYDPRRPTGCGEWCAGHGRM